MTTLENQVANVDLKPNLNQALSDMPAGNEPIFFESSADMNSVGMYGVGVGSQIGSGFSSFDQSFWNAPHESGVGASRSGGFFITLSFGTSGSRRTRPSYEELSSRLLGSHMPIQQPSRVEQETQWLHIHRAEYAGRWIAIVGNQLLAASYDATEVFQAARGVEPTPLVVRIEDYDLPFGGW